MATLRRIEKVFIQANIFMVVVLMSLMFILVFTNVVTRYFFNFSMNWAEELSRFAMIWTVFLGVGLAMRERRHVAIDVFQNMISHKYRKYFRAANGLIILGFMVILIILGYQYSSLMMANKSAVLRWSMGAVYLAIPVGALIFVVHLLTIFREYMEDSVGEELLEEVDSEGTANGAERGLER